MQLTQSLLIFGERCVAWITQEPWFESQKGQERLYMLLFIADEVLSAMSDKALWRRVKVEAPVSVCRNVALSSLLSVMTRLHECDLKTPDRIITKEIKFDNTRFNRIHVACRYGWIVSSLLCNVTDTYLCVKLHVVENLRVKMTRNVTASWTIQSPEASYQLDHSLHALNFFITSS